MRPPASICSPRSRALSCASPLMRPLTRSPSTKRRGRGVRQSSSHRPGRRTSLATARGRPRGIRTITLVKTLGRHRWKQASRYHRQGRVENTFFRYKSIIVDGLRARSPAGQGSEVVLGCEILNRMTEFGRPVSYRSGTGRRSASRRIVTIGSSVNRVFFMAPPGPEDAILSSVSWSEKWQAGQLRRTPHGGRPNQARNHPVPETFPRSRDLPARHDRFQRSPRDHPSRLNECLDISGRALGLLRGGPVHGTIGHRGP